MCDEVKYDFDSPADIDEKTGLSHPSPITQHLARRDRQLSRRHCAAVVSGGNDDWISGQDNL